MDSTTVYKSGNSQSIRIPKKYRFKTKEAFITKVGDGIMIYPKYKGWKHLFESLEMFSDDFTENIRDLSPQKREQIFK